MTKKFSNHKKMSRAEKAEEKRRLLERLEQLTNAE